MTTVAQCPEGIVELLAVHAPVPYNASLVDTPAPH
jgi:hypothetical protein